MFQFKLDISVTIIVLFTIINTASAILVVREEALKFFLYTSQHRNNPIPIKRGQLTGITLDKVRPVKVIIHGFDHNYRSFWINPMKEAYFQNGHTNVIVVDWSAYNRLSNAEYTLAMILIKGVGNFVGDLIKDVSETLDVSYGDLHLIGHSLGAHTAGFAGQRVFERTTHKLARISGLDPAGQGFNTSDISSSDRLSCDDAIFVDTIHAAITMTYQYAIGPVDFYPNGGVTQPGCNTVDCSNNRVLELFIESIQGGRFDGRACGNWGDYTSGLCKGGGSNRMGEFADDRNEGVFYLETNAAPPYACGDKCG